MAKKTEEMNTEEFEKYLKKGKRNSRLGLIITGVITLVFGAFAIGAVLAGPALWAYFLPVSTALIFSGASFLTSFILNLRSKAALKEWNLIKQQLEDKKGKRIQSVRKNSKAAEKRAGWRGKFRRKIMRKKVRAYMDKHSQQVQGTVPTVNAQTGNNGTPQTQSTQSSDTHDVGLSFDEMKTTLNSLRFNEREAEARNGEKWETQQYEVVLSGHDEQGKQGELFRKQLETRQGNLILQAKICNLLRNADANIYPLEMQISRENGEQKDYVFKNPQSMANYRKVCNSEAKKILEPVETAPTF